MKIFFTLSILFMVSLGVSMAQVPVNNECSGAIDLTTQVIGQPVGQTITLGPYDNTNATTEPSDPTTGFECFGEPDGAGATPSLENTLWFSFVGDGGIYYVRTNTCAGVTNYIDDGDTQIAVYTGTCGALVSYTCNEDGPEASTIHYPAGLNIPTLAGVTYYILVDGFKFFNALSTGEFCIFVTQVPLVTCTDPSLSTGNVIANRDTACAGDTLRLDITGVEAPNEGLYNGMAWVITNMDISGTNDPLAAGTLIASYGIQSPAPDSSFRILINNGQLIGSANVPYGTYYFTPVIFANATPNAPNPVFLSDLTLDPTCTQSGNSVEVLFLPPGDPLCISSVSSIDASGFGILNLYPNPVRNELSVVVAIKGNEDVKLSILDQLGRELLNKVSSVRGEALINISTSSLSAGVYFIKMESGTNIQHVRFMRE
ncbi:MAG: T9SS type A sorting domain-containing protein [Bacteroidia bacterium]